MKLRSQNTKVRAKSLGQASGMMFAGQSVVVKQFTIVLSTRRFDIQKTSWASASTTIEFTVRVQQSSEVALLVIWYNLSMGE